MKRGLLLRALWLLLTYDVVLRLGRLPGIHRRLRARAATAVADASPALEDRVASAIAIACTWYPHQVKCLQRAAATTELMRAVGIPAELVIGAVKQPLGFHAWVEVDGRAINERHDIHLSYTVLERC